MSDELPIAEDAQQQWIDFTSRAIATLEAGADVIGADAAAAALKKLGAPVTFINNLLIGAPPWLALGGAVAGVVAASFLALPITVLVAGLALTTVEAVTVTAVISIIVSEAANAAVLSTYGLIQQAMDNLSQATSFVSQSPTDPNTYVIQTTDASGSSTGSSALTFIPGTGFMSLTVTSLDPTTGLPVSHQYIYGQATETSITVPAGVEESITGDHNSITFAAGNPSHAFINGDNNSISGHAGDLVDVIGSSNHVDLAVGVVNVQGNSNTVTGNSDVITVQGSGDAVGGDSETINLAASSSVSVGGNNDVIVADNDDTVTIIGANLIVTAGNNFTLTANGNNTVNVTAGDGANIAAAGAISVGNDSSVTGGGEITAGDNATIVMSSGSDVTAGNNAVISAGLSSNPLQPTMIKTGSNAKVTVTGGYADIALGDGSVLTLANSEYALHFMNDNIHVVYAGQMIFGVDIYFNQNVMDYAFSSARLVDPVTGLGFTRYTLSRAGSPDEVIDEGDQYNTILTPLNFHFLDFDGNPAAFQQLVANVAPGQNIGMVQSLSTLTAQASTTSTSQGQATFIDKRPGETHTVTKAFDVTNSNAPEVGVMTVAMAADSGTTAGAINLSYAANTSLLHALAKTATPQVYVQSYDVSIVDHQGNPFTQTVAVDVTGYALTSVTGPTTATITENSTSTTMTGALTLNDADPLDVHHTHVTYVGTSGGGQNHQLGTLTLDISADTSAGRQYGTAAWSYSIDPALLASLATNQTITETFQISFDDGAGNTTAPENVVITLNTAANNGPATVQFDLGHTGTNMASSVVGKVSGTGSETATGKLFFSDTSLRDLDAASASSAFGYTNVGALTVSQPVKVSGGEYEIDWTYTATDAQIVSYLGTSPSSYNAFNISVSDGRGHTVTEFNNVAVNLSSDNRAPTVTAANATGGFTETAHVTGSTATDQVSGTISFSDANLTDVPAASLGTAVLTYFVNGSSFTTTVIPSAVRTVLITGFSLSMEAGNSNTGTVDWKYSIPDSVTDFLQTNETVKITVPVNIHDTHGGSVVQSVVVTIAGTDDDPVITSALATASLYGSLSGSGTETASGVLNYTDADLHGSHSVTSSAEPGSDPVFALGTFSATKSSESTVTAAGHIAWSYAIGDAAIDSLQDGQTVTGVYKVTVTDGQGGNPSSQDVDVSLTRLADQTAVASGAQSADITENASSPATTETATGSISFTDAQRTDVHSISSAFVPDPAGDAQLGTLTVSKTADTTGSGSGGAVAWSYAVNDAKLASLAPGQTVTETYAVNISDGHGGTTTQDVSINLHVPAVPTDLHFVGTVSAAFDAAEFVSPYAIGRVAAADADTNAQITYGLVGASASDFSIDAQGNLTLLDNSALDFTAWRAAVESAFGGGLTDEQIHAKFAAGFLNDPADAAAAAQLATEFDGTPYAVQVQATDANGHSVTKTAFLEVRDQTHDYADFSIQSVGSVSELAPVGTVVATMDGLAANEPYGLPYFQDPTGHFVEVGNLIETARPLDYAAQSHYDLALQVLQAPSSDQPWWHSGSETVAIDVTSADLQPGNSSDWSYTPVVTHTPENPAADVLIGNLEVPAGTGVSILIDGEPDASGELPSDSFEMRPNADGTQSLWLKGGAYLDREALGPDPILNLTLDGLDHEGSTVTRVQIPIALTVDNVIEGLSFVNASGQFYAGITPEQQNAPGLGAAGSYVNAYNPDYYDVSYSYSLIAGADDDSAFVVANLFAAGANPFPTATFAPNTVLEDRPYLIDIEVTGSDGSSHVYQETVSVLPMPVIVPDIPTTTSIDAGTVTTGFMPGFNTDYIDLLQNAQDPFPSDTLSVDPASIAITTNDGHPVDFTLDGSILAIDPNQFVADLVAGQQENISISYTISNGTAAIEGQASLTIVPPDPPTAYSVLVQDGSATWHGGNTATVSVGAGGYDNKLEKAAGDLAFSSHSLYDLEHMAISYTDSITSAEHADGSALSLTSAQIYAIEGGLTAGQDPDASGSDAASYAAWHYVIDDGALSFLAHGDHVTLNVDIIGTDTHGQSGDQAFVIEIDGPNSAPVQTLGGFAVYVNAGDAPLTGTVDFSDADGTDTHTVSPTTFVETTIGTSGTPSEIQHFGDFAATVMQDTTLENPNGVIAYTYTLDQAKAATLSEGEFVWDMFSGTTVDDGHGGSFQGGGGAFVYGVNSAPVVAPGGTTAAALSVDPAHVAGASETASGTLEFSDANWNDTHIVSASFVSSDGATNTPLGDFTDNLVSETAHTGGLGVGGTGGQIGWNYNASDAALATIADGTVVHETYDVAVADDHGATAHQQVILNLSHLPVAA